MKKLIISLLVIIPISNVRAQIPRNDLYFFNLSGAVKSITEYQMVPFDTVDPLPKWKNFSIDFTDKGFVKKREYYNSYDEVTTVTKYYFDAKGNPIRMNYFEGDSLKMIFVLNQDKMGQVIGGKAYAVAQPEKYRKWRNTYDSKGNLTYTESMTPEGEIFQKDYTEYDDKGHKTKFMVKEKEEEGWITSMETRYELNEQGDPVKEITGQGNKVKEEIYRYRYDDSGNWIQKIRLEGRDPHSVIVREISYY